ncbi:MAG: GTPase HflX [Chitinivibrionales bacterium]|nr:GTPase HflX [Chitinivibrionales bacterium]MBD3357645.1 GTPase HflX [Chitinivibrionales bacterium]
MRLVAASANRNSHQITTMFDIVHTPTDERVVLAGLMIPGQNPLLFEEDMEEMALLCRTAGAEVVETFVQKRERPVASTFLGSGKLREIRGRMREKQCRSLVIDAELSPGQIRTIEKVTKGKVIDRSQLILDIFAQHAKTKEARIQVELAQLRTLYPRLTHAWTHFSQQVGGIGTRGPGEKQLEVDRRLVQRKIADLNQKLRRIERSRATQRKSREGAFRITLVGYTNVGKSSLLNALSGSEVHVEDKLFATLDTSTRKTWIEGTGSVVISDTVGFIRKLPHHLVASFRSTLEVVQGADLLLVVLDASSPWADQRYQTIQEVLKSLEADKIPHLVVLNKSDTITDVFARKRMEIAFPDGLFVSAFNKDDMRKLREAIAEMVADIKRERAMADIVAQKTKTVLSG